MSRLARAGFCLITLEIWVVFILICYTQGNIVAERQRAEEATDGIRGCGAQGPLD